MPLPDPGFRAGVFYAWTSPPSVVSNLAVTQLEIFMNENFPRPAYGDSVLVLVPKAEVMDKWQKHIKCGSAIVGFMIEAGHYRVCYEGNLYGAENLKTFKDRAIVAYGRLTQNAPTIARSMVDEHEFEVVGKMSKGSFEIVLTPALLEWMSRDSSLVAA